MIAIFIIAAVSTGCAEIAEKPGNSTGLFAELIPNPESAFELRIEIYLSFPEPFIRLSNNILERFNWL